MVVLVHAVVVWDSHGQGPVVSLYHIQRSVTNHDSANRGLFSFTLHFLSYLQRELVFVVSLNLLFILYEFVLAKGTC